MAAGFDRGAALTVGADAVHALGDDPRGGGFAGAANAGHDEGMGDAARFEGVREGAHHGVLADEIGKDLGPVFPGQHLIVLRLFVGHCVFRMNRPVQLRLRCGEVYGEAARTPPRASRG